MIVRRTLLAALAVVLALPGGVRAAERFAVASNDGGTLDADWRGRPVICDGAVIVQWPSTLRPQFRELSRAIETALGG